MSRARLRVMEPIFASDDIHVNVNDNSAGDVGSSSESQAANMSSWGTVLVANASKARKLSRRDDLAAAKVYLCLGPSLSISGSRS